MMRAKISAILFILFALISFEDKAMGWGGLTHMTILDDVLKDPRLDPSVKKILEENVKYAKGGATGPDMSYFSGERYANMAHYCSSGDLARKMLAMAKKDGNPKEIAFAYGWMVHVASDSSGHSWVNSMVGGEYNPNNPEIVGAHRNLEMKADYYNYLGHATNNWKYDTAIDVPNKFLGKVYKEQYGCSDNAPGSLRESIAKNISQGWYNVEPSWVKTSQNFDIFNTDEYKLAYQKSIDRAVDALNSAGATLQNWDLDTGQAPYDDKGNPNPNYGGYEKCEKYGQRKDCSPVNKSKPGGASPDDTVSVSDFSNANETESLDSLYRLAPKKSKRWMLWLKAAQDANAGYNSLPPDAPPELRQEKLDKISALVGQLNDPSNWREFSANNPQLFGEIEETPDIAVLENGYFEEMVYLINKNQEPVRTVELDFSPTIVENQPVLVIPSGGLYGLEKSEVFKASLDEYVKQGGTLIVFSQQHGYEFSVLPVPQEADGSYKTMGGYGWEEDQNCFTDAAYIDTWHQTLAGQSRSAATLNIDGFISNYPSNSTILLKRTANGQPALLMYEYGEGRVIVTSMYSDFAFKQNQASSEEIALIRDMISWAKNPDQLPEVKPGQTVSVSMSLRNTTPTDASSVKLLIYNPGRTTLLLEQTLNPSIPAGQSVTIPVAYATTQTSALGIYHIDYILYGSSGIIIQPQAETDSGRFVVSNPPKTKTPDKPIWFSVTTSSWEVLFGSPFDYTFHVFNNTNQTRTLRVWNYLRHTYRSHEWNIVAAPNSETTVSGSDLFLDYGMYETMDSRLYDESGQTIGRYELSFKGINPSATILANTDKAQYAKGETVTINASLRNNLSLSWQSNVKINITDSKGTIVFEDLKTLVLPASGTGSVSTSFALPLASTIGSYSVSVQVPLGNWRYAGYAWVSFNLPRSQVSALANLPSTLVMGANTIPFTITNTGKINVNSGTIDFNLKAPDGSIAYSGSQPFGLAVGEAKQLDIPLSIPALKLGYYTLAYTQSDETKTGNPTKATIPNAVAVSPSLDKPSCKVREAANLKLELKNTGKFNLDNLSVVISAPDANYSDTQNISLGMNSSTSLNFSIPIPETISTGLHNVDVSLVLPGGASIPWHVGFVVAESALSINYPGSPSVSAGDTVEFVLENTGGVDTQYDSYMYLFDSMGFWMETNTGTGLIQAGTQQNITYTLPDQLLGGGYTLRVEVIDRKTSKITSKNIILSVSGLSGELSVRTDKDIYFSNEETTTLSTIVNQAKPMVDGNLHLEIACAEYMEAPEPTSFHIHTEGGEQGVLHFAGFYEQRELPLPITPDQWGNAYIRIRHEGAQSAYLDYLILRDGDGNLYLPYFVGAPEQTDITSEAQEIDGFAAWVTDQTFYAEWENLPSGISYTLVMTAKEGCGIVWQSDTAINQGSGVTDTLNISAGNIGYPGKFYLRGELTNSLGQSLGTSYYPFYIIDGDAVLLFNTDKRIYKRGETVTITGRIENRAPITAENLILTLTSSRGGQNPEVLLTEAVNLLSGGTYPFTITTTAGEEGIFNLSGAVKQNNQTLISITDQYEVANPLVSPYVDAPQRAGNEPFTIEVDLYNDGKVDATVQFGVQSSDLVDSQTITIPAFGMKLLQYIQQISKDVTYTFTFAGDYQETTTTTVTYGLGAQIQFGAGGSGFGVFPEGSVAVPVSLTNTGQLAETLAINFTLSPGDIIQRKTYYLQPGSNTTDILYFNLTEGDYQISATSQKPDASAKANLSVRKENQVQMEVSLGTQTDGLVPVTVNLINSGFNEINGSVSLTVTAGSGQVVWSGEEALSQLSPQNTQLLTLNINPSAIDLGNYNVQLTLLSNNNQPISAQNLALGVQGPTFQITQLPPYQTFQAGQEPTFTFRVKNTGSQEGAFDLRLKAYDLIDSTQRQWLKPNEEKAVAFGFMLPEDLEEKDYFADYELKASVVAGLSKGQVKYHLAGISLNVNASLDKPYYNEGEIAHLTINIQSPNSIPQNLFARVNYAGYEPQQTFTLNGNQVLIFDVPLPKITGEKLFYGIYHEGGRSIHLNSLYIHKGGDVITITTDKQVYNPGETVDVSVSGNASGNMTLSGPGGYTETFIFTGLATKSFTLPATVAAGTYFINAQLSILNSELVTAVYPFDVAGIQMKVLECNNDKGKYASSDIITTSLTISSNTTMSAIFKAWIVDPTGQYTTVGEQSISLSSSENSLATQLSPLSTSVSGIHRLVYGIYGPENLLLCSGSEAFDVGDAVLMGISTDKRDYPTNTEPVTVAASLYGSVSADLQLELDGSVVKTESVSLNGFTPYATQLQNIIPGPHTLKGTLTAGGLKSTKETSFTYALAFMPIRQISASPAYLDFGSISLGSTSTQTITLSSTGNVDLVIGTITLLGTNQGEFSIQNDNCSGRTVAPSGDCTLDILFSSASLGAKSASLSIPSNATDAPTLYLSLGAAGATALNLSINPVGSGRVTGTGVDCPGDCTESFSVSGATIQLTAAQTGGYRFVNWASDINQAENPVTVNMDTNKNVTANFAINTYTITATTGLGGIISPSGSVTVNYGGSQGFTIMPSAGYHVGDVKIDGISAGSVLTYTFSNVTSDHTIEVIFAINQYTITATAGSNGTMSPLGTLIVNYGGSQTFTITPNEGYHVAYVKVDGGSVGAVTTFTFNNVTSNHTIEVTFEIDNSPPVADAGLDQNVITGQVATLNGSKSFDPEGAMITFLWTFVGVPAGSSVTNASLSDVTSAKPQFTPDVNGAYRLQLIVNDGALDSNSDEVVVNATTPNVPPNANAGPDQNVFTGNAVQLGGSRSSDPDIGPLPLSYLWGFVTRPAGSLLTDGHIVNRNMPNASFIPDVDGLYELTLTVNDGNLSSEDTVQIMATTPNVPPNANAGADMTVHLEDTAVLDGSASNDPDYGPQPLTYLWSFVAVPTGSQLTNVAISGANTVSPSFTPDVVGTYVLQLMVFDGKDAGFDNVAVTAGTKQLATLGPVKVWLGLKNSDDQGTYFDLRVDLLKNGVTIATGETTDIRGITRNPSLAKEATVTFGAISNAQLTSGDILSLRILTKVTASGGHSNAVGLRLYYDSTSRPSRFGIEIAPDPMKDYFLHSDSSGAFLNSISPTAPDPKYKDSASVNRTTYTEIGTWRFTAQ